MSSVAEIREWFEVPAIAHYCYLFRAAFDLTEFEIEVSASCTGGPKLVHDYLIYLYLGQLLFHVSPSNIACLLYFIINECIKYHIFILFAMYHIQ